MSACANVEIRIAGLVEVLRQRNARAHRSPWLPETKRRIERMVGHCFLQLVEDRHVLVVVVTHAKRVEQREAAARLAIREHVNSRPGATVKTLSSFEKLEWETDALPPIDQLGPRLLTIRELKLQLCEVLLISPLLLRRDRIHSCCNSRSSRN